MMQQQNAYIESLEGLQREVQRFRHDYKNRMAGMYAQAKEGNDAAWLREGACGIYPNISESFYRMQAEFGIQ